jgi:hypothetical protein
MLWFLIGVVTGLLLAWWWKPILLKAVDLWFVFSTEELRRGRP